MSKVKSRPKILTTAGFFSALAEGTGLQKKQVRHVFEVTNSLLISGLKANGKFKLPDLGKFVVRVRKAGKYKIPFTGEIKTLPEKRGVRFRVSSTIKKALV